MLKNPPSPQYELEMISLEQLVPKDHLVRKVAKAIDFEFIRDEIAHLYSYTVYPKSKSRKANNPTYLSSCDGQRQCGETVGAREKTLQTSSRNRRA